MDWMEQATGISLDGGNGSLELAIMLIVLALVCILALAVLRSGNLRLRG